MHHAWFDALVRCVFCSCPSVSYLQDREADYAHGPAGAAVSPDLAFPVGLDMARCLGAQLFWVTYSSKLNYQFSNQAVVQDWNASKR